MAKRSHHIAFEPPSTLPSPLRCGNLMTPFGNFSTDPKLVQLMGERMVMSCISAVKQPNKKSSKAKKAAAKLAAGLLPRPRRSTKEMCSCNCDC
ncbi:UNVERIFIED_CONTAM: hypothetical protein NCL1_20886 [Trichonephila clavipes]